MVDRLTFETLRLPLAIALLALVGFTLLPRGEATAPDPSPSPVAVVLADHGGEVLPAATSTPSAPPLPTLTPSPTPPPPPPAPFEAEVFACRSISGPSCEGQVDVLRRNTPTVVALVLFSGALDGDLIEAVLSGPAGTIPGGAYALQGNGEGYYYTTFAVGDLPGGEYTITATRNGEPVASTSFVKRGG